MLDIVDDEEIDESWATNYKALKQEYDIFYREDVNFIHISCIYIDNNNEIQKLTRDKKELSIANYLTRKEISAIIQSKMKCYDGNIKNMCIFKYNINIEPENVEYFLTSNHNFNYLTPIKKIKDIFFEKTIAFFNDLNEVIILFYVN